MGKVSHLEKRASKAQERFEPTVSQESLDTAQATQKRRAYVTKLRAGAAGVVFSLCTTADLIVLSVYFLAFFLVAGTITKLTKGKIDEQGRS